MLHQEASRACLADSFDKEFASMGQSVASHTICEIDLSLYVENDNRLDRRQVARALPILSTRNLQVWDRVSLLTRFVRSISLYVENNNRLDRRNSKLCGEGKVLQLFPFISCFSPFAFLPSLSRVTLVHPTYLLLFSPLFFLLPPYLLRFPCCSLYGKIFFSFFFIIIIFLIISLR